MSDGNWKEAECVGPLTSVWTMKYAVGNFVYNFRIYAENKKGFGERAELKDPIKFQSKLNKSQLFQMVCRNCSSAFI